MMLHVVQMPSVPSAGPTGGGGRGRLDQLHEVSGEVSRPGKEGRHTQADVQPSKPQAHEAPQLLSAEAGESPKLLLVQYLSDV